MTLRIHAPNPLRVGETANVLVTSDNPGVVSLVYGAGLTGPATCEITGTRVWTLENSRREYGWNAPAAASDVMKVRHGTTIGFECDLAGLVPYSSGGATTETIHLLRNYQISDGAVSYDLAVWSYVGSYYVYLIRNTQIAALLNLGAGNYTKSILRMSFIFPAELSTAIAYRYRLDSGSVVSGSVSPAAIAGEHAGSCATIFHRIRRHFYAPSALSTAQQDLFLGGGFPSDACTVQYSGNEEGAANVYDASGNNYDGVHGLDAARLTTAVNRTYTDTSPVTPYALIAVTAVGTTGTTIDATRPRQGVPARASAAEKTETATQVTVTVEAPLVSIGPDTSATVAAYPATIPLQVCASPDGTVSLASDDANLTVDATVEVSGGSATITATASADVTGAIITATYGATTDTAEVTVAEVPEPEELLAIGPDTVAEVESYPAEIILLLTSNVDGDVEIVSDNENLIPMSPVTVIDGKAEVACLVTADVSGATITASRDPGPSDSCSVSVSEIIPDHWLTAGPDHSARARGERVLWPIRVESNHDGEFSVVSDPTEGLAIHGPLVIADGVCDFYAQPLAAGAWSVLVTQESASASLSLELLSAEPARVPTQYDLCSVIDDFMKFVTRKYGLKPKFIPMEVADVRSEQSTDRSYSRYAQGTPGAGVVHSAVQLLYQVMISYSSTALAQQDLGMLREEMDRYSWPAIGFTGSIATMFEPKSMTPRLTIDLQFDIMAQGR